MIDLDALLRDAARPDNWTRVARRCAWCQRVVDEHGNYSTIVPLDARTIATDGMCPACATHAMARIAARNTRHAALAA